MHTSQHTSATLAKLACLTSADLYTVKSPSDACGSKRYSCRATAKPSTASPRNRSRSFKCGTCLCRYVLPWSVLDDRYLHRRTCLTGPSQNSLFFLIHHQTRLAATVASLNLFTLIAFVSVLPAHIHTSQLSPPFRELKVSQTLQCCAGA